MNCISLSAFVGGCIDYKNMHGFIIKFTHAVKCFMQTLET